MDQFALRIDHLDGRDVRAGNPELPRIPAPATIEKIAAQSDRAMMTGREHASGCAQFAIQMPALGARPHPGARTAAADRDLSQSGDIDQQHIIPQMRSRPAVAARTHGDLKTALAREPYGSDHILRAFGQHDGCGKSGRGIGAPDRCAPRGLVVFGAAPEDFLLENRPSVPIIPAAGSFP
jgi:hypothetical protein